MQQNVANIIPETKSTWQNSLQDLITDPAELANLLEIESPAWLEKAYEVSKLFPLKVTKAFAARMQKQNLNDPLLLQVLPSHLELSKHSDFSKDPLEEVETNPLPGLIHKYRTRVLVTLTGHCAVHCRYCFRRHFPYDENRPGKAGLKAILNYIKDHPEVNEIILSGGDPLTVPDDLLAYFIENAAELAQIVTVRIHTRIPIVLPERINQSLINALTKTRLNMVIVLHCNHAYELDAEVGIALQQLKKANIWLLNQSVLLKGINDDVLQLKQLSEKLFDLGVLPYYLHLLDKVEGAEHFAIPDNAAKLLHNALKNQLPGYLVPKLVREIPKAGAKTWI